MPTLDKLTFPFKALCIGDEGTGKTGSVAALVNTGKIKVRMIDFDGNSQVLKTYIKPEFQKNIDIVKLKDRLRLRSHIESVQPKAFERALGLLIRWKYNEPDGTEVDLGPSSEWGSDTVIVMDSLTAEGRAAMRRALFIEGRVGKRPRFQEWGSAGADQIGLMEILADDDSTPCNVLVMAHWKLIGPPEEEKDDSDDVKKLKVEKGKHIPWRLCPNGLGKAVPQELGGILPTMLHYETIRDTARRTVRRKIKLVPSENHNVKFPYRLEEKELDVEDGLVKVFEAAGVL